MKKQICTILFPRPLPAPLSYLVPDGMTLAPGDFVTAPLGGGKAVGVVWDDVSDYQGDKLKPVSEKLDTPPLPEEMRKFLDFAAHYNCFPRGTFLKMALTAPGALKPAPTEVIYEVTGEIPPRMTEKRQKLLELAREFPQNKSDLARSAAVTPGVIDGLVKAGALRGVQRKLTNPFAPLDPSRAGKALNPAQKSASEAILSVVSGGKPILLDGVTGSGKTEVYFEAIAKVLADDKAAQVLVLLPEIALTDQILARIEDRFGAKPASWHSEISPAMRRRIWREVADGRCRLVIGARSALYLPFQKLGLIVVDEEHDASYKQEEGVHYQGRDMAVARAGFAKCPIILGSATPALETMINAQNGKYHHVKLTARHGAAMMPAVSTIDMRIFPPERGKYISPQLQNHMAQVLKRGEQVMLYLNRRGYAPMTLCKACGYKFTAPDSDTCLVEHKVTGRLVCHQTGFSMKKPTACPECTATDSLTSIGPGVERVAEEAKALFPNLRVEVFSSDTAETAGDSRALIKRMEAREIDILVGTQIMAKGHNFPHLTLVGVVDADLGMAGGDLRAGERTFQLLQQVAGRAGRADRPGQAYLQTYMPDHKVMQALVAGDRDSFLETETAMRELMNMPPFGRLAAIIISGPDKRLIDEFAREFAKASPFARGVKVLGPAEPIFAYLRGRHRRRFLVQADRNIDLNAYITSWRGRVKQPRHLRMVIDIDPYSFF